MSSLPIAPTAHLQDQTLEHLAIAVNGEITFIFPRGIPYAKVKKLADRIPKSHIRLQKVRVRYEILEDNKPYDTSPMVKY